MKALEKHRLYEVIVENHISFQGDWLMWRMAGNSLVSPDDKKIHHSVLRRLLQDLGVSTKRVYRKRKNHRSNGTVQMRLFD